MSNFSEEKASQTVTAAFHPLTPLDWSQGQVFREEIFNLSEEYRPSGPSLGLDLPNVLTSFESWRTAVGSPGQSQKLYLRL